jgi:DNA-binding NtrC family response regulator
LTQNYVNDIHREPNGTMWFATGATLVVGGLSRYDGKEFVTFTTKDGLPHNNVEVIHRDPDGVLWFGTWDGVSRYDGKGLVNFTTEDGLVGNIVLAIHRDPDGLMWFGTSSGVSGYDGVAWTSLDARDGLSGRYVGSILQDPDGSLWFGTEGGVTRYRRSTTPPRAYIVSVTTDQTYRLKTQDSRLKTESSGIPAFTVKTRVTIEYNSIDFKTIPEKRQYRCRVYKTQDTRRKTQDEEPKTGDSLESWVLSPESNEPYNPPTKETSFDWIPEESGTYIFQVQAIDRDLNYSEPASVELIVQPDPVLVSMKTELSYLRREVRSKYNFENIIGRSTGVREVRALMERAIDSGLTVLITGETGTGKELVAKAIHHNSPRRDKPILALNCGAVPKELIASSLFGHRKGAFTSAHEDQLGLFEAASGGTLLLDEIGEMPRDAQIQLLRVLEERVVQRIGEHTSREVDVRVMAMTNRDLMDEVTKGQFREDLYYRLSVFPIHIPPLRERVEDIPTLAEHFLHEYSQEQKKDLDSFAPDVIQMLQSYSWPGNVRELRNVIQRAAALAQEGDRIQIHHLPPQITRGEPVIQEILSEQMNLSTAVDYVQRRLVENALRECNGNRAQAARMLGLHRSNLVRLMKRLGIE